MNTGAVSGDLNGLVKGYLETKLGVALDFFAIEGQVSPDANGDIGVTGTYRKGAGDKKVFFTVTVNLATRKIQNLQQY